MSKAGLGLVYDCSTATIDSKIQCTNPIFANSIHQYLAANQRKGKIITYIEKKIEGTQLRRSLPLTYR